MKAVVINLDAEETGEVELDEGVFGAEPRRDILHRVVRWQRAKARQGTHKAKTRSETNYSRRKIYKQKGTGKARHGDRNAPIFRKGGVYGGPVPRSHAHDLPKKVRKLGLKHALSAKAKDNALVILESASLSEPKTGMLARSIAKLGWKKALIIDGNAVDKNFLLASSNLPGIDIIPSQGANVYDILKRKTLILTKAGVADLQERLK